MNFVDLSIQFQVEVSEENPNHPHLEQMQMILYSRPSGIAVGKQTGTVQDGLRQPLETIERHVPQECEKGKKQFRPPAIPDMQAGDLEDIGILVGEVYDERIIEDSLDQGKILSTNHW